MNIVLSSTHVLAHPSKQQSPKLGQSVSFWPGDQQFDTAPAHSASVKGLAAGHSPASTLILDDNWSDLGYLLYWPLEMPKKELSK